MKKATHCPVLITEDDPSILALIAASLRRRRLGYITATNGHEALRLLEEKDWLVLILDLMMPAVSGLDVIAWLAAHPERKPTTVIVVTAMDRAVIGELEPTVVNAVIFKPFNVVQLAAYVKASCDLQHEDRRRSRIVDSAH